MTYLTTIAEIARLRDAGRLEADAEPFASGGNWYWRAKTIHGDVLIAPADAKAPWCGSCDRYVDDEHDHAVVAP